MMYTESQQKVKDWENRPVEKRSSVFPLLHKSCLNFPEKVPSPAWRVHCGRSRCAVTSLVFLRGECELQEPPSWQCLSPHGARIFQKPVQTWRVGCSTLPGYLRPTRWPYRHGRSRKMMPCVIWSEFDCWIVSACKEPEQPGELGEN